MRRAEARRQDGLPGFASAAIQLQLVEENSQTLDLVAVCHLQHSKELRAVFLPYVPCYVL